LDPDGQPLELEHLDSQLLDLLGQPLEAVAHLVSHDVGLDEQLPEDALHLVSQLPELVLHLVSHLSHPDVGQLESPQGDEAPCSPDSVDPLKCGHLDPFKYGHFLASSAETLFIYGHLLIGQLDFSRKGHLPSLIYLYNNPIVK